MSLYASPLATRHTTRSSITLRLALALLLQALSRRLDALALRLESEPATPVEGGHIEFRHDPHSGQGVIYVDGHRRTLINGLERL